MPRSKSRKPSSKKIQISTTDSPIGLTPNPEGPIPPFPFPIPDPLPPFPQPFPDPVLLPQPFPWPPRPPFQFRSLRHGCYLIRYTPNPATGTISTVHYDGTMRVQRDGSNTTASGDLYLHRLFPVFPQPGPIPMIRPIEPNPAAGIPIFPINAYRYYVRVTQILEAFTFSSSFTLGFELHRFDMATRSWTNEGGYTALMTWTAAPAGFPGGSDYLTGDVKNSTGAIVGRLTMGWVSTYLRRAVVEIDRVSASESCPNNGAVIDWRNVFDQVGWDVTVVESNSNVAEPSGASWSNAEMHAAMLNWRDSHDLNAEWRYYVLCVRLLDETSRGIMFDAFGGDSNNIPREGAGISSHWVVPNADPWGRIKGMRFGTATGAYFRTAIHEIGHAMGLYHNTVDMGFMNTTDMIASSAVAPVQFPDNVQWSHAPDDQKRLRHMPDIWVRPGGIPFGSSYNTAPISPDDMLVRPEGVVLYVAPLSESVPIGAPVRVRFSLRNVAEVPLPIPESLSMKEGHVQGKVIDPSGTLRTFSPLIRCVDEERHQLLEPGQEAGHDMTLVRGAQGALFPMPGIHRIVVEVSYAINGFDVRLEGEGSVMITPPEDRKHADAAAKILSTPDVLLTLALGGDHITDGMDAIGAAMQAPALRPHFAYIEAKRLGRRFGSRKADLKSAATLIDERTVMSPAEVKRAAEMAQNARKQLSDSAMKKLAKSLKAKLTPREDEQIQKLVDSL